MLMKFGEHWWNSKPVNKKNPVKSHMIIELCSQFKDLDDLMIVRDLAMIIALRLGSEGKWL
jgi:hypothetical protein